MRPFGMCSCISEHEPIEEVAKLAEAIEEHGEAFALCAGDVGVEYAFENCQSRIGVARSTATR